MSEDRLWNWIDEDALAETHAEIFHYTNASILDHIFRTNGLFASNYKQTNDRFELHGAEDIVSGVLAANTAITFPCEFPELFEKISADHSNIEQFFAEEARKIYKIAIKALPNIPHLTCFSAHLEEHQSENGLLTMWRSYCNKNDGVALGFNTQKLVKKTYELQERYRFDLIPLGKVVYGNAKDELLERVKLTKGLADLLSLTVKNMIEEIPVSDLSRTYLELLAFAAFTKHADFEDEREIRLLTVPARERADDSRLRPASVGGKLIIECTDCLSSIMIGPTKNYHAVEDVVRGALTRAKRRDVKIVKSKTPFRYL